MPIAEYDSGWLDSFPEGDHLIMCRPGRTSRRYRVVPALAPLIAAGEHALDTVSQTIYKATELRPERSELTKEQIENWHRLNESLGPDQSHSLTHGSARDAAQAGIDCMIKEAEKMLTDPAIKRAWDQFMLVYHLTATEK